MNTATFLQTVVTSDAGWLCLASKDTDGPAWREAWFRWPESLEQVVDVANVIKNDSNVYFTSHLFSEKRSQRQYVLPSRTIQADLDYAEVATLPVVPTVVVKTSPGRHQAYWITENLQQPDALEALGRRIAYGVPDCDRTGWPAGHKVRLPGTINYKYASPHNVEVTGLSLRALNPETFNVIPDAADVDLARAIHDIEWVRDSPIEIPIAAIELLASLKGTINGKVFSQFSKAVKDRSAALWQLECEGFRVGLSRDQVYWLAAHSANNKFDERKYHGVLDLRKDILRAESHVATRSLDLKALIMDLRYAKTTDEPVAQRRLKMEQLVISHMRQQGEFIHAKSGSLWWMRRDTGRPIMITPNSEWLSAYLTQTFGLNSTEQEHRYVVAGMISYVRGLTASNDLQSLAYFDQHRQMLALHTGGRDVYHIGANTVETHPNGYADIVFQWGVIGETFVYQPPPPPPPASLDAPVLPALPAAPAAPWWELLFEGCLYNLVGISREEALLVLRAWFLFLLFRHSATTRPLLAFLGQPGCISGDTVLDVRRGEHSSRKYTIQQAYRSLKLKWWDRNIPIRVLSMKDGVVQWREVKDIMFSGKKLTYAITIGDNEPIYATADHRFLTPTGYKSLIDLIPGDEIVVKGPYLEGKGRPQVNRRTVSMQFHPHAKQKVVNSCGPYGTIRYYKAVLEAALNNMSTEDFIRIVHTDREAASKLKYLDPNAHIHHKDENPENDALENLEAMTKLEHDTLHGYKNVRNFGSFSGMWGCDIAKVKSIKTHKEEYTYDIEMLDDTAPNFLVNDVVVHNSGKTTSAKMFYRLIYGRFKSLSGLSNADDFDLDSSLMPFLAFDNCDSYLPWVPDRLAQAASNTSITRRKLYTDVDQVTLERQALVAVTAHNPKFTREDITDRMVLLMFSRLPHFKSETEILDRVSARRAEIWNGIVRDVQAVLRTPRPTPQQIPQFRIEDFARLGAWFNLALGADALATFSGGIVKMLARQSSINIEEDYTLVSTIRRWLEKRPVDDANEYLPVSAIWTQLSNHAQDITAFQRQYKNAQTLGRKLWVMQSTLKTLFNVDCQDSSALGTRVWRITSA